MDDSPLLTDLYELHMAQAYHAEGMEEMAVFDFIVRSLPPGRNFLVAAGLEQVLDYLERLSFGQEEIGWLRASGWFTEKFLRYLGAMRFTGKVDAMPEGTVFFPGEPVLRVSAPIAEAQLIESRVINLLQLSILIASKAVRCVLAARGRELVDFGMRRAHGAEAALLAARCSFIAGFDATATVLAGQRYGIPLSGTMAHSYVQAHASEDQAFAAFAHGCRDGCTLLVDTYDVPRALERVVTLIRRLRATGGAQVRAVRIDSGDLAEQAGLARRLLDAAGCTDVRIAVSGDLDEYRVAALMETGAPIDSFGIGTRMATSADAPFLDCAYKLAEYEGRARRKRSAGKQTYPGRKQVFRRFDDDGILVQDTIGLETEYVRGRPLLQPVMQEGKRHSPHWTLGHMRQTLRSELASLPPRLTSLEAAAPPPAVLSPGITQLVALVDFQFA
ncbi:nicotinate phosphoribosyltransferase [Massilia sp. WF1]|uniref:nicotinate phosphoribosyltransferase n=1 Tax=unclassified Massilia TaxID=2609279 RepID=UPI000649B39D|nr:MULTISPECIES: nicotinate phosphoribosyltransferase [unclassified Massilia]ALK97331.1 nicotinate phosphoribosyltransferase [Massilia sp. WG5]KLU36512.1 nicotinate phosphoribosyltransferase [Massilia sp. WF1]